MKWLGLFLVCTTLVFGDGIYTTPDPAATGGITGTLPVGQLTCALVVDSENGRVFQAVVSGGSNQFCFAHLPVGKYHLVLITPKRQIWDGIQLGDPIASLPAAARMNLELRIAKADTVFNRYTIHRCGMMNNRILALVERIRDHTSGIQPPGTVPVNTRQLEIIELTLSGTDWQVVTTRPIYRRDEPFEKSPAFYRSEFLSALSKIRVLDFVKELGIISAPTIFLRER